MPQQLFPPYASEQGLEDFVGGKSYAVRRVTVPDATFLRVLEDNPVRCVAILYVDDAANAPFLVTGDDDAAATFPLPLQDYFTLPVRGSVSLKGYAGADVDVCILEIFA